MFLCTIYNKLLKATKNLPDTEVALEDFIDVKGMKAQGNQLTKLKVKEIVLNHAIEGNEPWPEPEKKFVEKSTDAEDDEDDQTDTEEADSEGGSNTVEWDIKKKDDDEDKDQTKLF